MVLDDMVIIGAGHRARLVRVGDISTIEVAGNDITVRAEGHEPLTMRGSIAHCRKRFPEEQFFLANRGCLVKLGEIVKVNMASKLFALTMRDGTTVSVSRLQIRAFRKGLSL